MKPVIHSNFGLNLSCDFDQSIEIWIDNFEGLEKSNSEYKIFVQIEPNEIMRLNNEIISNKNKFTHILTYDKNLLNNLSNSHLFEYGTKWVSIEDYEYPKKNFSVSMVCGHKQQTRYHVMRQKIWMTQNDIIVPKNFYISQFGGVDKINDSNKVLGESKFPLFESMFHICIENVVTENFFTEKLIDCLLCKTIPIYMGCPNIENYFNKNGILIAETSKDIINICNQLTPEKYYSLSLEIEENYSHALKWIDYNQRLTNKLTEIVNNEITLRMWR